MVSIACAIRVRNLAVGALQGARAGDCLIELAGEPRAVITQRVDLRRQRVLGARGLAAPLDRRLQRIERKRQAPARSLDRIDLAHAPFRVSHGR